MIDIIVTLLLSLMPPCAHEDGPAPCYWDASVQGNGTGTSYVLLGGGTDG